MTQSAEDEIRRLIAAEKFQELEASLVRYAAERRDTPDAWRAAAEFIQSALTDVRARRAHCAVELGKLAVARNYTSSTTNTHLDVIG